MNPPQVIIELSEYNRLLELDKSSKAELPKSIVALKRLIFKVASNFDSIAASSPAISPHAIAKEFRRMANDDENLKSMLNE